MKQKYIVTAKTIVESINNIVKVITSVVCASPDATFEITFDEYKPARSDLQNDKLHAMLHDIEKQVDWLVDGELRKLPLEDWKIILSAGLKKNQRVAKGIEGGLVMLGSSTSKMKVKDMAELIEFIQWFGSDHNVVWSERGDL